MKLQKLLSYTRQAADAYRLIEAGDRIAVGLSGGKDSIALLYALSHLQKFYPYSFELQVFTVDMGFDGYDTSSLHMICEQLGQPYTVIPTQIGQIVFDERKEKHPCALCAKLRRGALNNAAIAAGCNKIAYGHHKDDMIETMIMSLLFEGRFYSFPPYTLLKGTGLGVIRPFIYVSEAEIKGFINKYQIPVTKNPCPADKNTRREEIKALIANLNRRYPGCKERLFTSIEHGEIPDWTILKNRL